jgi:anti-sigma28 factor (negative regulator of flagellin synthesis)
LAVTDKELFMDIIEKELLSRKSEIQSGVDLLFKTNMKITDWDVPEADDKKAAKILLDMIQERVEEIKADIEAGKYDNY